MWGVRRAASAGRVGLAGNPAGREEVLVRNAALGSFKRRIQVVDNVKKITSSMKMVAVSKMKIAQTRLDPVRVFHDATEKVYKDATPSAADLQAAVTAGDLVDPEASSGKHVVVVVNSDRGLCGALTSNAVRSGIEISKQKKNSEFCSVGSKGQDGLAGSGQSKKLGLVALEVGAKNMTFVECGFLAEQLLKRHPSGFTLVYNKFFNILKNELQNIEIGSVDETKSGHKWYTVEQEGGTDLWTNLHEFRVAAGLWRGIHEHQCCEHAVRYMSMDGASTNAGDLVRTLTLEYNKARQAGITTELSEIVSGMAAIVDG